MSEWYSTIRVLHFLGVLGSVAGLFVLGRLWIYHGEAVLAAGAQHPISQLYIDRLRRTIAYICGPALVLKYATGLIMLWIVGELSSEGLSMRGWLILILNAPLLTYFGLSVYWFRGLMQPSEQWKLISVRNHRILGELMLTPAMILLVIVLSTGVARG